MNFSTLSCLLVVPHDWLLLVDFYNIKQSFYSSMARSLSKHSFRDQEAPWLNNLHDMYKHWTFFFFLTFLHKINDESASDRESLKPNEFYRLC